MTKLDPHALYELDILRHVEGDSRLNNRLASRKLGVSIKLAHQLLGRMVHKGLLHVRVVHSRRWDYFLTVKGIGEKTRLTLEFLEFSMHFYREARRQSAQLCRDLAEAKHREIAFLGAGELAEITYLGVQEWKLNLRAVYAEDGEGEAETGNSKLETGNPKLETRNSKLGTGKSAISFMGVPVRPLCELRSDPRVAIIVCLYDKDQPMRGKYLPPGVAADARMHWIFAAVPGTAAVSKAPGDTSRA